ncbi:unnamed protein product [Miscanthus lutarioriparius]|uniref:Uncharacterized protein n=1 Tax=Miscanthus lutarioriparius TaxID=422564 RepID=A0A811SN70_9POAL|nr:unnamed protein product [Miscanthus lutarioriparius]
MTNNTIPHDHRRRRRRLRPHHQEMDQLQGLAVKPQPKRQARRRTHTSRPYQERLLNMAEARREIVTALKIHRASSTRQQQQSTYQHHHEPPLLRQPLLQQPQQQQQQQQEEEQQQVQVVAFQDRSQAAADEEAYLAHTTMSYAAASFANPLCNSPLAHWIAAASSYCSPPVLPCDLTPPELPLPTAAMGGLVELEHYHQYQGGLERLVHSLPAQPLGLNLSFQGFGVSVDDGAKDDCEDLLGLPLTQPSPAASYSYSPPAIETATTHACGHGSPSPALSATDAENDREALGDRRASSSGVGPGAAGRRGDDGAAGIDRRRDSGRRVQRGGGRGRGRVVEQDLRERATRAPKRGGRGGGHSGRFAGGLAVALWRR